MTISAENNANNYFFSWDAFLVFLGGCNAVLRSKDNCEFSTWPLKCRGQSHNFLAFFILWWCIFFLLFIWFYFKMPNQNWVFWQSQVWLSNLLCIGRRKLPKRHVNDARSSPISGEMWWMIEGHAYVAPKAAARCPNPANDDRSLSLSLSGCS